MRSSGQQRFLPAGRLSRPDRLRRLDRLRRRSAPVYVVVLLAVVLFAIVATAAPRALATTPGTPGTPQAVTAVFGEDFQNRPGPAPIDKLSGYTSTSGQTYTADPAWLSNCNGWVASANESTTAAAPIADCSSAPYTWNGDQQMAQALGLYQGESIAASADNYAVSAYTLTNPGAGLVEFQATGIPFSGVSRFVTFSVDYAAVNCYASAPLLQLSLLNSVGAVVATAPQLNACSSPLTVPAPAVGVKGAQSVQVGTYAASTGVLVSGPSLGVQMINNQGSGYGNDIAFDNVRIVDVTPQLDQSFSPTLIGTGGQSQLTFTVTNTNELAAKNGFQFTDTLPVGLTVASTPAASSTCGAPTISGAAAGSATIGLTGSLAAGAASCTFSVAVTAATEGTFSNCPTTNVVIVAGLNPPACSTLVVRNPTLDLSEALVGARVDSADQFTAQILSGAANGPVVNSTAQSTTAGSGGTITPGTGDTGIVTAVAGASYFLTQVGAGVTDLNNYAQTISCHDANGQQSGLPAGSAFNSSLQITPVAGAAISCVLTNTALPPRLTLTKSVSPATVTAAGQAVTYSFRVTNTATVTLTALAIVDVFTAPAGPPLTVNCPVTTLAPSASTTCTARYVATQADVDAGRIGNSAIATAQPPTGMTVKSPPSAVTILIAPVSGLTVQKSVASITDTTGNGLTDAGDVIRYSIITTNTGNTTLRNVTVSDALTAPAGPALQLSCTPANPAPVLAPGATILCLGSYPITQADVDNRLPVTNTATAVGTDLSGNPVLAAPSSTHTPVSTVSGQAVSVTGVVSGAGGVGDVVTWTISIINTGTTTLTGIAIQDPGVGVVTCPLEVLAPGESELCTVTPYRLTAADVAAGSLTNAVSVAVLDAATGAIVTSTELGALALQETAPPTELAHTGVPGLTTALDIGVGLLLTGLTVLVEERRRRYRPTQH